MMEVAIVAAMTVDWGSVPDWLAGAGAILAVIFAAAASRAAWKANQIQSQQLERLEQADRIRIENDERSQAQSVAVWMRMNEGAVPAIVCFNGSGLPVYSLRIRLVVRGKPDRQKEVYYAAKGPDPVPRSLGYANNQIISAITQEAQDRGQDLDWTAVYQNGEFDLKIQFRDSGGRNWSRLGNGELVRIQGDP